MGSPNFAFTIQNGLPVTFFFGALTALVLWIAYRKGYFLFSKDLDTPPLKVNHLFLGFVIYLGISFILSMLLRFFIHRFTETLISHAAFFISLTNLLNLVATTLLFYYFYFKVFPHIGSYIWKRSNSSYIRDISFGLLSWLIAFPCVVFFSELLEMLTQSLFKDQQLPDQVAIHYLKNTFGNPFLFIIACISIVIFAPIVEEFLFRGLLQSWLKKWLGLKPAIIIASLIFAFFHYSSSQKLANLNIVGSLFLLALFLGFIYERQKSLIASIFLHATFNALSIINLILQGQ